MRVLKRNRCRKIIILSVSLIVLSFIVALAHPGGTDGSGGHLDHSTGEYHFHHGYPAHQHVDMDGDGILDCPYDFDDKTSRNSGSNGGDSETRSSVENAEPEREQEKKNEEKNWTLWDIIIIIVICLIFLPGLIFPLVYSVYFVIKEKIFGKFLRAKRKESNKFPLNPATSAPSFCKYCGNKLSEDSVFCSHCGRKVKD